MATGLTKVAPGRPLTLAELHRLCAISRVDLLRATAKWRRDARGLRRLLPPPGDGR